MIEVRIHPNEGDFSEGDVRFAIVTRSVTFVGSAVRRNLQLGLVMGGGASQCESVIHQFPFFLGCFVFCVILFSFQLGD